MGMSRFTHRTFATTLATVSTVALLSTAAVFPADAAPAFDRGVSYDQFMNSEILLGSFFTSDGDHSDTLYISTDGTNFEEIGVPYQDAFPADPGSDVSTLGPNHHTLGDPSIVYHGGAFWMISGWNRFDGKLWPMIGVSQDGRHWSYPEGLRFGWGYDGIPTFPQPSFGADTVTPEWIQDRNGNLYIMFSIGYYGEWHGEPTNDRMEPYLIKVNQLSFNGWEGDGRLPNITFKAGPANRINLPQIPSANRIDGSAFQDDDGMFYMTIKRDGAHNEIWRSWNMGTDGWELVNADAVTGSEGPSMTKLNGKYYLYTDKLHSWGPDPSRGNLVSVADSPYGPWTNLGKINTYGKENRHGTVIRVTDPTAKSKLYSLYTGRGGANPLVDGINAAMMRLKVLLHLPKVPTLACSGLQCRVNWV